MRWKTVEIETRVTPFNRVTANGVGERIDLDVEGATFATWHPERLFTGYSWDALAAGCLLGPAPPRSVLVLGLGGGTVTRQLRALLPQARLTGVEIDAGVIQLARRHMDLDAQGVSIHVGDAYRFLADSGDRFDAIIDDLFLTGPGDVVRSRVPAGETLALLRSRLAPEGVLVANFITDTGAHKLVRKSARAAFLDGFPSVRLVRPPRGLNEILVGGEATRPGSALDGHGALLSASYDRKRFREISVRLLRRRAGSRI